MYQSLYFRIKEYITYRWHCIDEYSVHSPFVFTFINEVLHTAKQSKEPKRIASYRKKLYASKETLSYQNYGAGRDTSSTIVVRDFSKRASIRPKYGKVLSQIVRYFNPQTIIELGTAVGLGTCYLGIHHKHQQLITIEGNQSLATYTQKQLKEMGIKAEVRNGLFDDVLNDVLSSTPAIDLVYIDGNHNYKSTMSYFMQCLPNINEHSILIFDDIYWSRDMKKAWLEIIAHQQVRLSIDLFQIGIVFFKKQLLTKEHYRLCY